MAHAFISYVRENQVEAERLSDCLSRFQVHTWLDREAIRPGTPWQLALRTAIERGSFFLACFSQESEQKVGSYMEEELRFAVELLGRRSADYGWLIPIRLSDCKIPALPLHDGRTLRDIQWVDLFDDWNRGLVRLVETIRPLWLVDADRSIRRTRLEHGCNLHIDSKIRHFTKTGALRIQQIEERWLGLLRGEHMALFLDAAINLFDRATSANVTMTEQILEPGDTGRLILITAASAFDERTILHSLREQNPSWGCYMDFIKERRRSIRGLPNWKARDLVHWIFRQESPRGEMEIDLLYLCGHTVMLDALAFQLYLAEQEGAPQSPIEQVYPTTLMTTLDISQLVEEVLREEAALSG